MELGIYTFVERGPTVPAEQRFLLQSTGVIPHGRIMKSIYHLP